jgi:ribose transport system substrate-binding protein
MPGETTEREEEEEEMTRPIRLSRGQFVGRSLAFGALLGTGGLLSACGGDDDSEGGGTGASDGGPTTELRGKLAAHEFSLSSIPNQQAFEALETIGGLLGLDTVKLSYDENTDKELAQIDQMGTLGVTAVETLILDNAVSRQIAEAAVRNDLYISTQSQVGFWLVPSEPGIDWHYQCLATPPEGALVLCNTMFEEVGGEGNFVHLQGAAGSSTDAAKTKAVDQALAAAPGMTMVARQRADYNRDKARNTMDAILTANGDDVQVVYCANDDMALGVLASLEERGLTEDVAVSGADAIPEVVDNIIAGKLFGTEGIAPPFLAGYCLMQSLDAANGHRPDPIEGLMQMDLIIMDNAESAQAYKDVIDQGAEAIDYLKLSRILHPDDWDPQWPIRHFEPEAFWAESQGVPKPAGYELPEDYTSRVAEGGYEEIDSLYIEHFKEFPFADAVRKSRTGKTAFELLADTSYENF